MRRAARHLFPQRLTGACAKMRRQILKSVALLAVAILLSNSARAEIDIVIPELTPALENNIRAFLSLTRYAERDDITAETMSRLQRRIVAETRDALQPLGYYEPEVTYEVVEKENHWQVTINVVPGRPVRLSQVNIDVNGPGADLRQIREIIEAQALKPGLRLNHGTFERVKGDLLRAAKNAGFLDAQLTKSDLTIDRSERRATATIQMDTGERYHYGAITIAQDVVNDDSMRRMLRMREGDPYTLDSLLRSQYVLDDSLYFSGVDIESGEPNRETRTVPITVTAEPNRKHRFATSIGYGTDTRVRGRFIWDNRRVNASGHRSKVELLGSSVVKQLTGRYVIPVMDVALEKLEFTATLADEELGQTISERAELGAGLTEVMGRWQRVLFLRLSQEETTEPVRVATDPSAPDAPAGEPLPADPAFATITRDDFYLIPGISYSTMPSYIVGGRPRPYYFYAELRGSPSTLGSDASFLQLRLQGERIFDLSELWHLHMRAELGASRVADFSELPASQRFFAGGERSVRGFGLNELAGENGTGGRHLATGTLEVVRDLPRNFGVAAFYDIGNAFDSFSDTQLEYSAGLGVRYRIAVASFGIDVAQALSESGRNPRFHLYISTQF